MCPAPGPAQQFPHNTAPPLRRTRELRPPPRRVPRPARRRDLRGVFHQPITSASESPPSSPVSFSLPSAVSVARRGFDGAQAQERGLAERSPPPGCGAGPGVAPAVWPRASYVLASRTGTCPATWSSISSHPRR
ncbi:unnamed protein product [Gulo gulo]|uniref:Uncharacterized protein n=1 Tax=Gulo gulo TaxID=48420 RepID=A0A9X9Q598_GULGU|nr:unnamed protein product [Gulo gulo]